MRPTVAAVTTTGEAEVAAISAKNKNKNQNQRGGQGGQKGQNGKNKGQGNQNQSQSQGGQRNQKGPKHATAKGDQLCRIHHKFGVNATFCADPWKCEMKTQIKPPQ